MICTKEFFKKNKDVIKKLKILKIKIFKRKTNRFIDRRKIHQGIVVYCINLPKIK